MSKVQPLTRGRLLVVEDEPYLAAVLKELFVGRGYETMVTGLAAEAVRLVDQHAFDLVLLDLSLKDGSGLDVCKHIRSHPLRSTTPIIMLTSKGEPQEKERGVMEGADYYLTKPMPVDELLLWVRAMLRRSSQDWSRGSTIGVEGLRIHIQSRMVIAHGDVVKGLTAKEFALLFELAKSHPKALKHEEILSRVWGTKVDTHSLEVHVQRLRRKLGPQGAAHIVTVRGLGYRLE